MKTLFVLCCLFPCLLVAQTNKELAWEKAKAAIKLMDEGEIEQSIAMLKECQELDPEEYTYPYEIAYARVLQEDYKAASKILVKVKKYKNINSQVYQMLGNCYSYQGKPKKAIKTYEEGMKLFPEAGNLHLEKGNIFLGQEQYGEAAANYKRGILADPNYPSNYFRLALLYLESKNKLYGLIYGEIFMNLERTTQRTQLISELLLKTYKEVVVFKNVTEDETEVDVNLCQNATIVATPEMLETGKIKMPFCFTFGASFSIAVALETEINLSSLARVRHRFIKLYLEKDQEEYPNVLLDYHAKMLEEGHFDAYNHYLFQIGAPEEFAKWLEENEEAYNAFADWYTKGKNELIITRENCFLE